MIYIESAMIGLLGLTGIICAISDIKKNIVPNRVLAVCSLIGLGLHIIYLFVGGRDTYAGWALNMAIADLIGIVFYAVGVWAAGDLKLFMVLYFLIPPRLLDQGTLTHSIMPFVLIFVPSLLWILVDTVIQMIRKEKHFRRTISFMEIVKGLLIILVETNGLLCLINLLFPQFTIENQFFVSVLILLYAMVCTNSHYMKKWLVLAIHGVIIAISWIIGSRQLQTPDWRMLVIFLSSFVFQRFLSIYNYKEIPTADVKKGMILSADTIALFTVSRIHDLPSDMSEELSARLTETEADAVKRWENSKNGKPTVKIVRKIPFAIMIFIGFAAWLILRIRG